MHRPHPRLGREVMAFSDKEAGKAYKRAWRAANSDTQRLKERARSANRRAYRTQAERERRASSPEKYAARTAVLHAVQRGRLARHTACENCGRTCVPHGHHDDYSKPLSVRWLCASCHRNHHAALAAAV